MVREEKFEQREEGLAYKLCSVGLPRHFLLL